MSAGEVISAGKCPDVMQPETLSAVYKVVFQGYELAGRHWIMAAMA